MRFNPLRYVEKNLMSYCKEISALLAGGLLAFAFAPMAIYPLAIFSPALLLLLWLNSSASVFMALGCHGCLSASMNLLTPHYF